MAIHPPSLYTGFVGMTIPFAFGIAALDHRPPRRLVAARRAPLDDVQLAVPVVRPDARDDLGVRRARLGRLLGAGIRSRTPALLPWFTATAFLHSVMVQERRSMLRVWNVTLVIVTFFLTIFGTFMTRSGVVQSVHAFGEDRELARLFTGFMVVILDVQLRPGDLPAAAAAGRATSSTRGCRARRRSSSTTGSCCSRRSSSCSRRCSRR